MFKIMQVKKTAGSVEQRSLAFKDLTCVAKRSNHLLCSCASFPLRFYCSYFCSHPPFVLFHYKLWERRLKKEGFLSRGYTHKHYILELFLWETVKIISKKLFLHVAIFFIISYGLNSGQKFSADVTVR